MNFCANRQVKPATSSRFPKSLSVTFQPTPTGFRLAVETGQRETEAAFFPEDQDITRQSRPAKAHSNRNGLILDLKKDANLSANPAQLKGVLELSGGREYEIVALPIGTTAQTPISAVASTTSSSSAPITAPSLSWSLLLRTSGLAFLGGLAAQPHALRLSGALLEGPRAGQLRQ